jgi:hypothetical protein
MSKKNKDRVMRAFIASLKAGEPDAKGPTCGDPEVCLQGLPGTLEMYAGHMAALAEATREAMAKAGPLEELNHSKAAHFMAAVYADWKELIARMDDAAFTVAVCGAKMGERGREMERTGRARP